MQNQVRNSFPRCEKAQEKRKLVNSENYTNNLCEKLFSLLEKQEFSDICIIGSDDVRFHAHKNVLSVGSDFFMAMFGGALKESRASEVKIQEINGETLKPILGYIYTGKIELHTETVEDILRAANFFQIKPLIVECYNFMGEELDATNCLGISLFAEQHGLKELYEKAHKFACTHFQEVCKKEEFLELNEDQVSKIISSEDLCVSSEETVFLSLVKWIENDKQNREKFASKLFSHVRYWLLSSNFIKQHRNKLPKEVECMEMICNWLEWHLSPDRCGLKSRTITKIESPNEKLVLFSNGIKQTYNPELNTWSSETLPGFPSSFEKIIEINNKLIIQNDIHLTCFDLQTNRKYELPQLDTPRILSGLATYKNELYVLGGSDRDLTLDYYSRWKRHVDKFNFSSRKWQALNPTNYQLTEPLIASTGGILYIIHNSGRSIIRFDPDSSECAMMDSTPCITNKNVGLTSVNGKIFFVGGATHKVKASCDLIIYDPLSCKSEEVKMKTPLRNPKCTSWNNNLIVCGGYDNTDSLLNLVQEYNIESKTWRNLPPVGYLKDDNYDIISMQ